MYVYEAPFEDRDDLRITSYRLKGESPWLAPDRTVAYGHVLLAAGTMGWSADAVVSRLTELGYGQIERPDGPLPATVDRADALLVNTEGKDDQFRWLGVGARVPLRYVLAAAGRTNQGPAEVARRMAVLGYEIPADRPLPEIPEPRDIVLIRTDRKGDGKWLDWDDEVPLSLIHTAARELRMKPHEVADRLTELGFKPPATPRPEDGPSRPTGVPPSEPLDEDDLLILSQELDGREPWLYPGSYVKVPLPHVLRASLATGRSPADVVARLAELGRSPHENAKVPEVADPADIRLLTAVDRSLQDGVHLEHVLRGASLTGRSPADVAARLTELGYRLPDEVEYPEVRAALRG
ncbi:hypothetical protein GCM10009654_04720 [Streptomyces hebeiensis]|uniref:wHTH-Hsp90 Na associated domain-containing protein n=1 Tax=Streptomyces hebeiensis TaxID=229486 RepID=A0ABP4F5J7_9ACTN